jgi:hypothetical protein
VGSIARAAAVAVLGAMAGAVCLVFAFSFNSAVVLEMDRDLPSVLSGVYPPERDGDRTFAWTSGRAELMLNGLERQSAWSCTVRFRGGRSAEHPQPLVELSVDGIRVASRTATNEYEDLEVTAPPSDRPGLVLTIAASPTVVPGPGDPRALGVQVDRLACQPGDAITLPPRRAVASAMLAAAMLGAALALLNMTAAAAVGAAMFIAAAQAIPFSSGPAPYGEYPAHAVRLAFWIACALVVVVYATGLLRPAPLRNTARFVFAFSAGVLYLKLLTLLHPSKALIDALFQAHRLQWVLEGRYFFTQPMPDGVQFPYAIGLYVVAAPWSALTRDYVTLLRVVVCAADVVAGALLYLMIVRTRGDRLGGAIAVALFSIVPLSFWFVGNANLTNAFAQAAALATVAVVTILPLRTQPYGQVAVMVAVMSLAFLSHVSAFAILLVTLGVLVVLYWFFGGSALRAPARWIALAAAVAVLCSIGAYYGHFGEVYKRARRVRAESVAVPAPDPPGVSDARETGRAAKYAVATPFRVRLTDALTLTREAIGWPILLLAAIGAWRFGVVRTRDRLLFAVMAWGAAYLVFLGVALMRVDVQYQRYSYEFVGRVAFATYPAAVILAAQGAVWAWRAGTALRLASAALLLSAVVVGVQGWLGWIQ